MGGGGGGGGAPCPPPLPKIEKKKKNWRKIVIFHTKYPNIFAPPSTIGKNMIFWRKIEFFTRNTPTFSRLPRQLEKQ